MVVQQPKIFGVLTFLVITISFTILFFVDIVGLVNDWLLFNNLGVALLFILPIAITLIIFVAILMMDKKDKRRKQVLTSMALALIIVVAIIAFFYYIVPPY
ncbi:MAG: hypothetical protein ABSD68_00745 [Candidatus Micrarchaeales archaeon]